MRPADHPEFYLRPAPEGRSRESTIVLDGEGRFWHEGALVEHPRMAEAMHRWITRHPEDGRYILSNGYDWTYITVEDTPFFVRGLVLSPEPKLLLSDGSSEPFPTEGYRVGRGGALYCPVKGGAYQARFTPAAQSALGPVLGGDERHLCLNLGERVVPIA